MTQFMTYKLPSAVSTSHLCFSEHLSDSNEPLIYLVAH